MTLNWVNIESARQANALKMKVFDQNIETQNIYLTQAHPQNSQIQPEIPKMVDIRNASQMHAQKIKVDRLYKETPKSFLTLT